MTTGTRFFCHFVFGAALLAGCGSAATPEAPSARTAAICDGSSGVRLAVVVAGGGPILPGMAMLAENGWSFLLVDGSCNAWILTTHNDPLRTLVLSHDREQRLASQLRLSEWKTLEGSHAGGCPDAPGISYRFDSAPIYGSECGLSPGDPLQDLNTAFNAQIVELAAAATAVSGDMRYLLLPDLGKADGVARTSVPWPLDVPAESVALTQDQAFRYTPGGSLRATGLDASRLRAIRTTMLNGSAGNGSVNDFTYVMSTNGNVYQLFARDSVPFEMDNGLLPAEIL